MIRRGLLFIGILLFIPLLWFLGLLLYRGGKGTISALQHQFLPPTRITIVWPSHWDCDEYQEAYRILKIEYPNSLIRYLFKRTSLLVPYPRGKSGDTTAFHSYYSRQLQHGRLDTVIVRGRFGYDIGVGERGLLYQCEDVPYFDVSEVYSKRGKILKRFVF